MGRKTSVYLSDDLAIRWRASSLPLSEVIRRGLEAIERETPDLEATLRRVVREELSGVSLAADRTGAYSAADGYSSEPYEGDP